MSAQSDPDRLARLAKYVVDDPSNTTPAELREALMDAAERIRSLQARDRASRKLVADLLALHSCLPDELPSQSWCKQDGFSWPCPTVRLIEERR